MNANGEVKCITCWDYFKPEEMVTVRGGEIVQYECLNDQKCRKRRIENRVVFRMSKEGQVYEKFGVNFEDLVELHNRYRNGQTHYRHNETGAIYTWGGWGKNKKWTMDDDEEAGNG